jgi:hypothetical protein
MPDKILTDFCKYTEKIIYQKIIKVSKAGLLILAQKSQRVVKWLKEGYPG